MLLDEPFTGLDPRGIRTMKELIREHADAGAAIIVSSHLLTLFEDLITKVLILHRGRVLRHGRLDVLRGELASNGRQETLEELFFRLTETPSPARDDGRTMNGALGLLIGLQLRGWLRYLVRSLRTRQGGAAGTGGRSGVRAVDTDDPVRAAPGRRLARPGPAQLRAGAFAAVLFHERGVLDGRAGPLFPTGGGDFSVPRAVQPPAVAGLQDRLYAGREPADGPVHDPGAACPRLVVRRVLHGDASHRAVHAAVQHVDQSAGRQRRGAPVHARRKIVLAAVVLFGVVLLLQVGGSPDQWQPRELLQDLLAAPAWKIASRPLRWFFDAFLATRLWPDLVESAALAALVNLALVGVVFALDAQYLEASATASRIYARVQRLRRGGIGSGEGLRRGGKVRVSLPMLPWLGGIGPMVWRQLTTALRGADRLLLLLLILGTALIAPILAGARRAGESAARRGAGSPLADAFFDDDAALRFPRRHRSPGVSQDVASATLASNGGTDTRAGAVDDRVTVAWAGHGCVAGAA